MKRLGELLLERGAIDVAELYTALEACHRRGKRLGTELLRFGFVEERGLLEALSEQLGVPFVPEQLLLKAAPSCTNVLQPGVMQRLQVVPFERLQRRLRVAMANPRDLSVLEELAERTDLELEPYVATETAIAQALELIIQPEQLEPLPELEGTRPPVESTPWERLWDPPCASPDELLRCWPRVPVAPESTIVATFPDLTPVYDLTASANDETLDDESYLELLVAARHRDEVADLLVRYAERYLERVCLFALHRDRVLGWMGRGPSVVEEDVRSFAISTNETVLFTRVLVNGAPYLGPVPSGRGDRMLMRILGEPPPANLFVIPFGVKDRPIGFLVGDNPGERGSGIPTQELANATRQAGIAFEIMIMKAKLQP